MSTLVLLNAVVASPKTSHLRRFFIKTRRSSPRLFDNNRTIGQNVCIWSRNAFSFLARSYKNSFSQEHVLHCEKLQKLHNFYYSSNSHCFTILMFDHMDIPPTATCSSSAHRVVQNLTITILIIFITFQKWLNWRYCYVIYK